MNQENKRQSLRIPITAKVQFEHDGQEAIFFTENLSTGGFLLKTQTPPFVGAEFKVQISLPEHDELIHASCEVMWRQEGEGCGVRMYKITQAHKKVLQAYIDEQTDNH
jgi:uncharacterized protein (TIGR02266 family)